MFFVDPIDRYGHAIYASFKPRMAAEGWMTIRMNKIQVINPRKAMWLVYEHEKGYDEQSDERRFYPLTVIWGSERNARMRAARLYRPNVVGIFVKPIRFRSERPMKYALCPKCKGSGQCWDYDPRCYNCFGLGSVEWAEIDHQNDDDDDEELFRFDKFTKKGKVVNPGDDAFDKIEGTDGYSDDERYERQVAHEKDRRFRWRYKEQEYVDMDCMFLLGVDDPWNSGWSPLVPPPNQ